MGAVSIVLPTFDRPAYLRAAVDSVLAQTLTDWELVVADDGSNEETRAYLRSLDDPRVRVLWLPHSGNPSVVRNAAIAAARGDHVAFLDSDDVWKPQKLEKQMAALRQNPDCRWSYTHCDLIDAAGRPLASEWLSAYRVEQGWILESLLRELGAQVAMPTIVAERRLLAEIGGLDERQRWCEDFDLCLRLAMRSPVTALSEPLCSVRSHGEHHSGDRVAEHESRVKLYGKMAALLPEPRLRSLCRRKRAEQSLVLARLRADRGDRGAPWISLAESMRFAWPHPRWWLGALKIAARPLRRTPRASG
jgi:GT2 family glycosyltransferase